MEPMTIIEAKDLVVASTGDKSYAFRNIDFSKSLEYP